MLNCHLHSGKLAGERKKKDQLKDYPQNSKQNFAGTSGSVIHLKNVKNSMTLLVEYLQVASEKTPFLVFPLEQNLKTFFFVSLFAESKSNKLYI